MFTGIIEALGTVRERESRGGDCRLRIGSDSLDFSDLRQGDSIAVSGVCLTVVAFGADWFRADVSNETLALTSLGDLAPGDLVNLEKALRADARLGGHLVSGHVDGLAEVLSRHPDGRSERLEFRAPAELARYIAAKGSVCLDGVSLTVNTVERERFTVNIIPHTAEHTTIHQYRPGRRVNLEVDQISRYLERLLEARLEGAGEGNEIDRKFLSRHGFLA